MRRTPFAEQAIGWARKLTEMEASGPGDTANAIKRLQYRHPLPPRCIWELRYRPPADVLTGVWTAVRKAYLAECLRQKRLLEHEIELTKAVMGDPAFGADCLGKVQALVNEAEARRCLERKRKPHG